MWHPPPVTTFTSILLFLHISIVLSMEILVYMEPIQWIAGNPGYRTSLSFYYNSDCVIMFLCEYELNTVAYCPTYRQNQKNLSGTCQWCYASLEKVGIFDHSESRNPNVYPLRMYAKYSYYPMLSVHTAISVCGNVDELEDRTTWLLLPWE